MPLPAIRAVDLFPIEHEGQTLFCLNDPEGIVEEQLVMAPAAGPPTASQRSRSASKARLETKPKPLGSRVIKRPIK